MTQRRQQRRDAARAALSRRRQRQSAVALHTVIKKAIDVAISERGGGHSSVFIRDVFRRERAEGEGVMAEPNDREQFLANDFDWLDEVDTIADLAKLLAAYREEVSAAHLAELTAERDQLRVRVDAAEDAIDDIAGDRTFVRCLLSKGHELTRECAIDKPCAACRAERVVSKLRARVAELEAERKRHSARADKAQSDVMIEVRTADDRGLVAEPE